jgi:hypothetical protein
MVQDHSPGTHFETKSELLPTVRWFVFERTEEKIFVGG